MRRADLGTYRPLHALSTYYVVDHGATSLRPWRYAVENRSAAYTSSPTRITTAIAHDHQNRVGLGSRPASSGRRDPHQTANPAKPITIRPKAATAARGMLRGTPSRSETSSPSRTYTHDCNLVSYYVLWSDSDRTLAR